MNLPVSEVPEPEWPKNIGDMPYRRRREGLNALEVFRVLECWRFIAFVVITVSNLNPLNPLSILCLEVAVF